MRGRQIIRSRRDRRHQREDRRGGVPWWAALGGVVVVPATDGPDGRTMMVVSVTGLAGTFAVRLDDLTSPPLEVPDARRGDEPAACLPELAPALSC
jgi:hypothetical protein